MHLNCCFKCILTFQCRPMSLSIVMVFMDWRLINWIIYLLKYHLYARVRLPPCCGCVCVYERMFNHIIVVLVKFSWSSFCVSDIVLRWSLRRSKRRSISRLWGRNCDSFVPTSRYTAFWCGASTIRYVMFPYPSGLVMSVSTIPRKSRSRFSTGSRSMFVSAVAELLKKRHDILNQIFKDFASSHSAKCKLSR